jgi:hypothetical protein
MTTTTVLLLTTVVLITTAAPGIIPPVQAVATGDESEANRGHNGGPTPQESDSNDAEESVNALLGEASLALDAVPEVGTRRLLAHVFRLLGRMGREQADLRQDLATTQKQLTRVTMMQGGTEGEGDDLEAAAAAAAAAAAGGGGDVPGSDPSLGGGVRLLQEDEPAPAVTNAGAEPAYIIKRKMTHTSSFSCPRPGQTNGECTRGWVPR